MAAIVRQFNGNAKSQGDMHSRYEEEGDEPLEPYLLEFTDEDHNVTTLSALNAMRRNRHFCDVILHVGNTEIHAHRAVLASASPYLFDLFTSDQDPKHVENIITYKLNGGFDPAALQQLIDYAYTAQLRVKYDQVKAVYLAANHLKMERVSKICTNYLIQHLNVDNCIEIRSLSGIMKNKKIVQNVDEFIVKEFPQICQHISVLNLRCAKIEVLNQSREEMSLINQDSICRLVLEWIRKQVSNDSITIDMFSDKTFMLYLAIDNSLQDCSSLPAGDVSDTEIVQDYKKLSLTMKTANSKRKQLSQPTKPRVLYLNRETSDGNNGHVVTDGDEGVDVDQNWWMIAVTLVAEHSFLALVTLGGHLWTLSVQLRLNAPAVASTVVSPLDAPADVAPNCKGRMGGGSTVAAAAEPPDLYCALAHLSSARCACGCADYRGTLIVCGGYDRRECLRSVEQYFPVVNEWRNEVLPAMREGRGRFNVAILGDALYAIGGCNGITELDSVEVLDLLSGKWSTVSSMPLARSNLGVCSNGHIIYCVGGWNGQVGIKQCDAYNAEANKWLPMAPLNIGRYQAGVTVYNGLVFAIGGCNAWNCLNSVEVYSPATDQWTVSQSIISARRGCGVAVFDGKLYVVGGSDGTHSLSSTEVFDEESQTWLVGPSMTVPRANVQVAVVDGRMYAVGGYSGKSFLNTMEYLDSKSNEWTTFVPKTANCSLE